MKHITRIAIALSLTAALLNAAPSSVSAQTPHGKTAHKTTKPAKTKKTVSEVKYKAQCGMIYSAADAKKNRYVCPMDHQPLVKVTTKVKTSQHHK
jgi:hypothetical protein